MTQPSKGTVVRRMNVCVDCANRKIERDYLDCRIAVCEADKNAVKVANSRGYFLRGERATIYRTVKCSSINGEGKCLYWEMKPPTRWEKIKLWRYKPEVGMWIKSGDDDSAPGVAI